jgi:hypothetical protein
VARAFLISFVAMKSISMENEASMIGAWRFTASQDPMGEMADPTIAIKIAARQRT